MTVTAGYDSNLEKFPNTFSVANLMLLQFDINRTNLTLVLTF